MSKIIVKHDGEVLDYLLNNCTDQSKSKIRQLFKNKCVAVNGDLTSQYNKKVRKGDVITFQQFFKTKSQGNLPIIYEDQEFVVINKPSGLLSVSTKGEKTDTAYNMVSDYIKLKNKKAKIFVLHRLDRETSGVLVFAKNENIKRKLQNDWNKLVTKRGYIAICEGRMKKGKAKVKSYLKENKEYMVYSTMDKKGDLAITNYNVKRTSDRYSYVEVYLETGKKNQIRVHMNDLGHPIAGDKKYYAKTNPLKRLALHSHVLEFRHPDSHKLYTFAVKAPGTFKVQ